LTVRGLIIRPDKTIVETTFRGLADYQAAVGGYIEAIYLSDGTTTLYCDEEYLIKGLAQLEFNSIATDVAGLGGRPDILFSGVLGPVVIVGPPNQEGETTGITGQARSWVKRVAEEAGGVFIGPFPYPPSG
jgi:hypothetical protein